MIHFLKPGPIDPLTGLFSLSHNHGDFMRVWRWASEVSGRPPDRLALLELLPLRVNLDKGEERPVWRSGADHAECPLCPLLAETLAPLGWGLAATEPFPRHLAWRPPGTADPPALLASRGCAVIAAGLHGDVGAIAGAWSALPVQAVDVPPGELSRLLVPDAAYAPPGSLAAALRAVAAAVAAAGAGRWPFLRALHYALPADSGNAGRTADDGRDASLLTCRQVLNIEIG
jgi:hypothetical protein